MRRWSISVLFVLGLILLLWSAVLTTSQPSRPLAPNNPRMPEPPPGLAAASDEAWPTLPDGRIVFDIYARRVAITPCTQSLTQVEFYISPLFNGEPRWQGGFVSLKEAISEPRVLRAAIAASDSVDILLTSEWAYSKVVDGTSYWKTHTGDISLTVYRVPATPNGCWPNPDRWDLYNGTLRNLCAKLTALATDHAEDQDADGLIVARGPNNALPPLTTRYVVPLSKAKSAVGLPVYFDCDWGRVCVDNNHRDLGPQFRFAPDLGLSEFLCARRGWVSPTIGCKTVVNG